jgi:Leucine-rich repeat (LRR) protein
MKLLNMIFLGGILGSECPKGCDCQVENKLVICLEELTTFPDISKSPDIEELLVADLGNEITNLPRLAHSLPRLRILNLSHNQLVKISRGSLPSSVEDAWLDFNKINSISGKIFSDLPNVMRIYLRNVSLTIMFFNTISSKQPVLKYFKLKTFFYDSSKI